MMVRTRIAGPDEVDRIIGLHDETGYAGDALSPDRIIVAVRDGHLVGAFRPATGARPSRASWH